MIQPANTQHSPKSTDHKPRIGITLGDINGIGPEVIIKALSDHRVMSLLTPVVYGSGRVLSFYKKQLNNEELNYTQVKNKGHFIARQLNLVNCWDDVIEIVPGKASKETGKAALLSLQKACEELKEGLIDALVTAPIDKQSIHSEEFPFKGHTEFLTQYFGASESLMLLVGNTLRVGLVTEHVAVREIAGLITRERIESKLKLLEHSLRNDFGINKPKIAILGLNPHAGDGGLIGTEEEEILKPLVNDWRNKGKLVSGPFPADGFFASGQYTKFDGILAMYHDQGLIPFKTLAFENGINFTAGLSVVRTSPDHGTAYAIAGKNQADENSFREALFKACDIIQSRKEQLTGK
ncbi:4-hydroxythreonine-4-phosphate dehydrogenase PdxA [Chryseotalea sanaruensis]|uniref:4-hydroxythreonine-4-phosphate dehydrogenase PdxA n=1 Tax=Chryseotalea sanaruensis TaxID=2482724 RepID=A0A401UER9_9BACT|nr:4-hydroxythreonine-4-phosphate dehydrogenase PdxA [Chryseotalea sanaruensis]GCC53362.1 4-hydroxythreonine-4-phosphate dehydrogenase PdxA [Chryseotalea sanaruensis]